MQCRHVDVERQAGAVFSRSANPGTGNSTPKGEKASGSAFGWLARAGRQS